MVNSQIPEGATACLRRPPQSDVPNGPPSGAGPHSPPPSSVDLPDLLEAATSFQEVRLRKPKDVSSWGESFRGRPEHAALFVDLHRSDPAAAERLARAVTALPEV